MAKRLLASFLSLVMVFSFTVSAYAESTGVDGNVGIESTEPTIITEPEGDGEGFNAYEFDDVYDVGDDTEVIACADCGNEPCTCEKEPAPVCETCGSEPCICEPAADPQLCAVCNADPCTCEEAILCEVCGADPCTCELEAEPQICQICNADPCTCEQADPVCPGDDTCTIEGCQNHNPPALAQTCDECGATDGHAGTCSQYEAPSAPAATACPECGMTEGHSEICITLCTCETDPESVCSIHPSCPECGVKEGELHLQGCEEYIPVCTCGEAVVFHEEDCDFYLEPVTAEVYTEEDGIYTKIEGHGESAPIDVEDYNDQIVYILASDEPQNLYFEHGTFLGIGVTYSINDETYACLNNADDNTWLGSGKALVTVAGSVPVGSEIVLTADAGLFGKQTITIKVVDEISVDETELEATVDGTTISVMGAEIPETVNLAASAVTEENYHEKLNNYIDDMDHLLGVYDINLLDGENLWQPESESVSVTLDVSAWNVDEGDKIVILHDHDGNLGSLGKYTVKDGTIAFETDGFSVFYFYLIFEFDGYEFILSGGSEIKLSELLLALGIDENVSNVKSVEFSDPSVVDISRTGNDWLITSLGAFGSEEYMTIVFYSGEEIEICVTDPVIYNYAVGNNITNVGPLATVSKTVGTVTNGDNSSQGKTYTMNSISITEEEIKAAGTTDATATATHMVIYVAEGMAIRFEPGTEWPTDGSRPNHGDNGVWFWSWDGTDNYAVIEGSAGDSATFALVESSIEADKTYYCNVTLLVVEDSAPSLLKDNLPAGYSIKNVPVTLYNYDGKAFNEFYDGEGGNYFAFSGTSMGVDSTTNAENRGWTSSDLQANGGGSVALMGIMQDELVNGLPVTSQGQQVDLFSSNTLNGAKDVYENVGFQFIYNEETGYYSYNSALNHAQYNSGTNEIELYEQSLAPSDTPVGASHGNAGFYPFEDIDDAFTNTGYTPLSTSEWKNKLERNAFELIPSQYSTDIALTSATNSTADMHYGLQVKSAFYLPENKLLDGEEMIYEFTGDDDLWVYIDGQLVLDIGGGHTYVSGSFNLTTGEVWVEKYTQLAAADGGSYSTRVQGTDLRYTDSFLTSLEDDQMHTIQIFYLERHGGVSNCRMHFNLPLAPMNAVEVSKTLVNQNGEPLSVTPDVEYTFQIFTAEDDDDLVDATNFVPLANKSFFGGKTNDQGMFKLKAGETAQFEGIPRFAEVYVVEIAPNDGYVYTGSIVSVNGETAGTYRFGDQTDIQIVQKDEAMSFDFTNYMQTQPLTIEKQVVNGTAGLINPEQEFAFTLDFTKTILETGEDAIKGIDQANATISLTDGGTFNLGHAESITIPRVPVNMTFTLKEENPDTNNSFDAPVFSYVTCTTDDQPKAFDESYTWTMGNGKENKITVTNQQRFDLTITKDGISNTDHHAASGMQNEERQSTIYTVVGKIDDQVIVEMDVAICGNDSVIIRKLPVGSYTVEENTDWAWRYDPTDGAIKDVTILPDATAAVDYENNRTKQYWLSGDCYVENWFTNGEIKKRNGSGDEIE